jgi:hypothetical protein
MGVVPVAMPIGVKTSAPSRLLLDERDSLWGEASTNTAERRRGAKTNDSAKATIESRKTTPI